MAMNTLKLMAIGLCFVCSSLQGRPATDPPAGLPLAVEAAEGVLVGNGQSTTRLPDGSWLLLGGAGTNTQAQSTVQIRSKTGTATLAAKLLVPRSGHSATLLPDGKVWIFGGVDQQGTTLASAEIFNPADASFTLLPRTGLIPRSQHSATVLLDGSILIAGGLDARSQGLLEADLYDPRTQQVTHFDARLDSARLAHLAKLLPNNAVLLLGGVDAERQPLNSGVLYDHNARRIKSLSPVEAATLAQDTANSRPPSVLYTNPAAGANDFAVDQRLVVLFSKPMASASLNNQTLTLRNAVTGEIAINPVPAENGLLLFITPAQQLLPASDYMLFINGAHDLSEQKLPFTMLNFQTARLGHGTTGPFSEIPSLAATANAGGLVETTTNASAANQESQASNGDAARQKLVQLRREHAALVAQEAWHPDASHFKGDWRMRRAPITPRQQLTAPIGVTALAGQVLSLHGRPLMNVKLSIGQQSTQTDATGRFLLLNSPAGRQTMSIDGGNVGISTVNYGTYQVRVDIKDGQTTTLDYTIWLPSLDPAGTISIPSPTQNEVVLTSPSIPGLELRLPPGTVIRDQAGNIVTQLNLTAIPTDRPPFPIPAVRVPTYFTIQPGAAIIQNVNGNRQQGARLIYPNFAGAAPGSRIDFWNYDAHAKGWYVYGQGTVSQNGKQVVPDDDVVIYEFTGAMVSSPSYAPADGPPPGGSGNQGPPVSNNSQGNSCKAPDAPARAGDPVDLYTGLFIHENTDLVVNDTIPLEVRRTYRPNDTASRAVGLGANLSYDIYLVGDTRPYTYQDLVLPDGARIHFTRTSPGTGIPDAVYTHTTSATRYFGATIKHGKGECYWHLSLKDGGKMCFPESDFARNARGAAVTSITDVNGNTVQIERDALGNLLKLVSPNRRTLRFTYDSGHRITQAHDDIGRTVAYAYDEKGRLSQTTNALGNVENYTYDSNHRMLTVQDWRENLMVQNEYDDNGRVRKQTYADGKTMQFAYALDVNGKVTQTDVTDERGIVTRYEFSSAGYPVVMTLAPDTALQQTTRFERNANNQVTSQTDALGRKTVYGYDANGNMNSITRLAGTSEAVTTSMIHEPKFNQMTSYTDALGKESSYVYDVKGRLIQSKDANGNKTVYGYNKAGELFLIENGLGKKFVFGYSGGDLVRATDPLARSSNFLTDAVGRTIGITDPLGNRSSLVYDALDQMTQVTNPMLESTNMVYDPNSNLTQVKDAKANQHDFVFDKRNAQTDYTDPIRLRETYGYDEAHNLVSKTDRKGQVTRYAYDGLNRVEKITFHDGSTISLTYDKGNRIAGIADSLNGTINRSFDDLNRLTKETTARGSVSYTYYANGLRKSMTVSGQPTVSYAYDAGNRLIGMVKAAGASNNNMAQTISFKYDAANRRTQTTLPNGISMNYSYDDANQLTAIVYKKADGGLIGDLSYTYDAAGRRTSLGGSLANIKLGEAVTGVSVNAANQLTQWNGQSLTYDENGNLLTDGSKRYVWNARDQLVEIQDLNGNVQASFSYDAVGRRQAKTINGGATGFVYDGINIAQELAGVNVDNGSVENVRATYLMGDVDEVFAQETGNGGTAKVASYLTDALGSTLRLTNSAEGKIVDYSYDAYGGTSADSNVFNPFQYTGRENDGNGLHYYRARYYSGQLQRFLQADPLGLQDGDNTYAYVGNNPMSYIDPLGLYRYNNLPPKTVPVEGKTKSHLECLEYCLSSISNNLGLDLLVTGGAEKSLHSKNSHHYTGNACDIAAMSLKKFKSKDIMVCAAACGFGAGHFEKFKNDPNRDHWHFQNNPGNKVPAISNVGFPEYP